MLVVTFGITGIAWLSQSLRFIDFIVNKGLSLTKFIYLSGLIIPSLLYVIIPVGVFISVIFAYNKLSSESELVIFKAAGIDNFGIIKPILKFAVLCTLISYLIALFLLPKSYREFKDMQNFIRNNYASILIQEGVFSNPTKGLTVYIRDRDKSGVFKGLMIHNNKNKNKEVTIMAQEAYIENSRKGPIFVLLKGSHQEVDKKTNKTSILYFDKYNLFFDMLQNQSVSKRWREPEERYISELLFVDEPVERFRRKLLAEGHQRITWPITNLVLSLLACLPFVMAGFSRMGNGKNIAAASLAAIIYLLLAVGTKNLVSENTNFIFLMYAEPVICLITLYILIFKIDLFQLKKYHHKKIQRASNA